MSGLLILCSTPIGNLADVSERLRESLAAADTIYAEDTRRSAKLLKHLGVSTPLRSYFVGNEANRQEELGSRLAAGETIALVTDAGTPGISDPGYTAVRAALAAGARITVIPGPSAATAALVASGLPSDRFVFEGFLPRRGAARSERIAGLGSERRTIVLFTSKTRLVADLEDLSQALDADRRCAVARELTKINEELWRGTLGEAVGHWGSAEPKGEFTLVIEGAPAPAADLTAAVAESLKRVSEGSTTADAVRGVATERGVSRRELYEAVIEERPT
ncbi:MAG: 16S rRNA (cytidine(1402)-2'-O)-methyltransferase [Acidimicrobiia bacterium]